MNNTEKELKLNGIESDSFNEPLVDPEAGDLDENIFDTEGDHIEAEDILPDEQDDDY